MPHFALAASVIVSLAIYHDLKPQIAGTTNHQYVPTAEALLISEQHKHLSKQVAKFILDFKAPPAIVAEIDVTAQEFVQWSKVNICEEGGNWHVSGKKFSGGLGITVANWFANGGAYFSTNESTATPDEQIVVARRIQINPPDQTGCTGSW